MRFTFVGRREIKTSPGYGVNRARISLASSEFTVPLLSRIYRAFDGDMVAALVLGEIGYRSAEGFLFLTRTVANDFEDLTARNVEELLATARRLEGLLANLPTPLGSLRLD